MWLMAAMWHSTKWNIAIIPESSIGQHLLYQHVEDDEDSIRVFKENSVGQEDLGSNPGHQPDISSL